MKNQLGYIDFGKAMIGFAVICAVGAFVGGMFSMWLVPKLWSWLKPFIHAFTA